MEVLEASFEAQVISLSLLFLPCISARRRALLLWQKGERHERGVARLHGGKGEDRGSGDETVLTRLKRPVCCFPLCYTLAQDFFFFCYLRIIFPFLRPTLRTEENDITHFNLNAPY